MMNMDQAVMAASFQLVSFRPTAGSGLVSLYPIATWRWASCVIKVDSLNAGDCAMRPVVTRSGVHQFRQHIQRPHTMLWCRACSRWRAVRARLSNEAQLEP